MPLATAIAELLSWSDALDTSLRLRLAAYRQGHADKTMAQQLAYSYRKIRERWHGDLRLVRSDSRDSASGGRTWSVIQRHPQTPKPSSASSGSSADADHADHPDDQNPVPERCDDIWAGWPGEVTR